VKDALFILAGFWVASLVFLAIGWALSEKEVRHDLAGE
jgi:hypothetical protein